MNPFEQEEQIKVLEVFDGRCVVRWRSRCSPRENVREHEGHVWVALPEAAGALVIVGEDSAMTLSDEE